MGFLAWVKDKVGHASAWSRVPLEEARFTVLDTELTGLDVRKDDIVSIGALHMTGRRLPLGGAFQTLVRPTASLDGRTVVVHRITPEQLEGQPLIQEVLKPLLRYLDGTVLVGHFIAIDLAFLDRDMRRWRSRQLLIRSVDTLALYGWLRKRRVEHPALALEAAAPSLFDLARAFDIEVEAAHTALGDAYVTAQVLQRLLPLLQEAGIRDLGGLCRIGHPRQQLAQVDGGGGHAQF